MNKYTFSTKTNKAYYCNSIPSFIKDDASSIMGQLVHHAAAHGFGTGINDEQAWGNQIEELQKRLKACQMEGDIIFEYDIVRLGKRIDVVLLIRHMVFSLEFKNGKKEFKAQDAQQAEDYALDIKNFHKESENLYVCPILIATEAPMYTKPQSNGCYPDKQIYLQRENMDSLIPKVRKLTDKYGSEEIIDFEKWFNSPYYPTPTIISAAVQAYRTHNLSDIAKSKAGKSDVEACEKELYRIIDYAEKNKKKCICFVTGVPGAGKTLVGLDVVSKNLDGEKKKLGAYISGNGPLVEVLREALKRSVRQENKDRKITPSKKEKDIVDESIKHLIESSFHFKKEYVDEKRIPPEHILVFDEAQRVWNKEKMKAKHREDARYAVSEPHFMFNIMDRHKDWAVMVCLVGLGQDIYDGEVGINEWFKCGIEEYKDWELFYSSKMFEQLEDNNIDQKMIESCPRCCTCDNLHLSVTIRSFRADKQNQFVDCLLSNQSKLAAKALNEFSEKYPVFITRDYEKAKKWIKSRVRGSERCGVLACSSAQRLKPEGIYVPTEIDVKNWFLAPSDDLRSSNMMEIVASEFKVQGLEIDWALVCWDSDLRRTKDEKNWDYYTFRGTKWCKKNQEEQKRYLLNSYRVLLTRARQGMVIFVPMGVDSEEDPTRDHKYYDAIYDYLLSCGLKEI